MKNKQTTILYFSGEGRNIEDFMMGRDKDFPSGGVLLSYWVLRREKDSINRMNKILGETK